MTGVVEQRSWRARCEDCRFVDRTSEATKAGPRHSRDTGHTVDVEVVIGARFVSGIAQ